MHYRLQLTLTAEIHSARSSFEISRHSRLTLGLLQDAVSTNIAEIHRTPRTNEVGGNITAGGPGGQGVGRPEYRQVSPPAHYI